MRAQEFLAAMRQAGLEPDCDIVADGRLHRFRDWLDKPGTKNGWYVLFPDDPPAGAFGCWKRGISERWSSVMAGVGGRRSRDYATDCRVSELLAADQQRGREMAERMWAMASPANGRHGYLHTKRIGAHGTRYLCGAILVPVRDISGRLHGLQRIYPGGHKRFAQNTSKRGHFFMIGEPAEEIIGIAEGFATAATIYELIGLAVAVAFDAGNLQPVAEALQEICPHRRIFLCGDNDRDVQGNPGRSKAIAAAEAVGGMVLWPEFWDPSSRGTDFNDLYLEEGPGAVQKIFKEAGVTHVPNS